MADDKSKVLAHPEVQVASPVRYIAAFLIALVLMQVSTDVVASDLSPGAAVISIISVLALIAVLAQVYLLFKLDLSQSRAWLTVSFVFTVPLFVMAVTLTLWMFYTLGQRTTLPGPGM